MGTTEKTCICYRPSSVVGYLFPKLDRSPLQISNDLCSASIFTAADSWPLEKAVEYSLMQLPGHLGNYHILINLLINM